MFFLRRGMTWLGTTAIGLFCIANYPVLRAWQANAEEEARLPDAAAQPSARFRCAPQSPRRRSQYTPWLADSG